MEKDIKKLIFTIVYAIALVAAFVGAVQLLYNAINMFNYEMNSMIDFDGFQKPLADKILAAAIFAIIFVAMEIISIVMKNKVVKLICFSINIIFIILVILKTFACKDFYIDYLGKKPYSSIRFALYQEIMAMLVTQIVYMAIIFALNTANIICILLLKIKTKLKRIQ